jgi:hypothetical protein
MVSRTLNRDKAHIHDVSQNHTGYDGENVS